jgi:hypothetical protein
MPGQEKKPTVKLIEIVQTKDSDALVGRLCNWKFNQAQNYLNGQPEYVRRVVNCLAHTFGNCGWFEGAMGAIVGAALNALFTTDE